MSTLGKQGWQIEQSLLYKYTTAVAFAFFLSVI